MNSQDFIIAPEQAGQRLDHFLAAQVESLSRSRLQNLIKEGHVTLNEAAAKTGAKLRSGDRVALREPPPAETGTQPEQIPLDILFEDNALIVINKPPGLVVHPAAGNWAGTVVNALLHHCRTLSGIGGELRPGIVHRLDKETSGCLVAAKSDAAHQALGRQFAGRQVTKIYLALAAGRFPRKSGVVEAPIGRHPVHRKKMTVVPAGRGRSARTDWRVLAELKPPFDSAPAALLECTLHTGRTHQIRVHLKHLGHPVLGDEVYGQRGLYPRQMLHAWKLGFRHPLDDREMLFTAPIPDDFFAAGVESRALEPGQMEG